MWLLSTLFIYEAEGRMFESCRARVTSAEVVPGCSGLNERVEACRERPLESDYPYLCLDAKQPLAWARRRRLCVSNQHESLRPDRRDPRLTRISALFALLMVAIAVELIA